MIVPSASEFTAAVVLWSLPDIYKAIDEGALARVLEVPTDEARADLYSLLEDELGGRTWNRRNYMPAAFISGVAKAIRKHRERFHA